MRTFVLACLAVSLSVAFPALRAESKDIYDAARNNDVTRAKQLIADRIDIDKAGADGFTPLILAAYNGSPDMVDLLLDKHADLHTESRMGNALMAASFRGYAEIVGKLIKSGARVNDANEAGGTALMFASLSGRTEVVHILLANGANVSARDRRGLDAATLAEQQGNQELADALRGSAKAK